MPALFDCGAPLDSELGRKMAVQSSTMFHIPLLSRRSVFAIAALGTRRDPAEPEPPGGLFLLRGEEALPFFIVRRGSTS